MNAVSSEVRRGEGLRNAALLGLLALSTLSGAAEPPARQVLLLQSFNRGNEILDHFTGEFRVELDQRAGNAVNVVQITVGPTGFVGAPEQAVVDFIRSSYANRPAPDLVVTVAGPAAVFARTYRAQLFPGTPFLFSAVDQRYLQSTPAGDNETAVSVTNDFPAMVDDILRLLPETRQIFMVIGSGVIGKFWRQQLEKDFERFHERVTFIWPGDLSLQETLRRCATLPDNSAIFFLTFGNDASGTAYADERVIAELHARSNAPLFATHDPYFGSGIVGGRLMNIDELARNTANSAIRILNGAAARTVAVPPQMRGRAIFDWRELQRWGIPESRLPAGSEVRYRRPSLWSEYRTMALVAIGAFAVQALLIIGLLLERRARRRAEIESRKNLTLAADTSRRVTMSALTGSIAHEISQPLSAMMYNAEALQLMINASRATPENILEVLSDIHADGVLAAGIIERHRAMLRGHHIQEKPIDLQVVVDDTLALLAHDLREHQITVTVRLSSTPRAINGDAVLLEQVLVNLVLNAMDAMAETPPDRRHLKISSDVKRADVEISVRDGGSGLSADLIGRLFTPFITTKPHGLGIGLAIARNIVEAHGGRIDARNNPEGGATFTVTLRASEVQAESSATIS